MGRLLVQVTCGPESPTRATLALLLARTAIESGHHVSVFFVGDAVVLLLPDVMQRLQGLGTGGFSESYSELLASGADLFASRLSAEARGLTNSVSSSVRLATPADLVELVFQSDRILTY